MLLSTNYIKSVNSLFYGTFRRGLDMDEKGQRLAFCVFLLFFLLIEKHVKMLSVTVYGTLTDI